MILHLSNEISNIQCNGRGKSHPQLYIINMLQKSNHLRTNAKMKPASSRDGLPMDYLNKIREQDRIRKRRASLKKLVKGNIMMPLSQHV